MQRTRLDRRKYITVFIVFLSVAALVVIDYLTKRLFLRLHEEKNLVANPIIVIENFFYFSFIYNTGSAYGFLSGAAWAQTFFKIMTPIAVIVFGVLLWLAVKNNYIVCTSGLGFVVAGTIGNYIDRVSMGKVIDFICLEINGKRIFGIFNFADVMLSVGVVLIIVHFLFLDKNALFGKKDGREKDRTDDTAE